MSYYLHLLRVYIEALELHSQSSCSFNSHTAKAYIFLPLTQLQGFLYINYKFPPYNGVVYVGQIGSVLDIN
jgi:hypothetical protein